MIRPILAQSEVYWLRPLLVAVALAAGGPSAMVAQEGPDPQTTSYLGVLIEGGIVSFRDDLLVPLGFTGPGLALGGSYAYRGIETRVDIELSMRMSYGVNRFDHEAVSISSRLRGSWLRHVREAGRLGELWVGVVAPLRINDMYIFSWDDAHMYWVTSYGLGPSLLWRSGELLGGEVAVGLDLPLLFLVSRPPSYRQNKQDGMNSVGFWYSEPNRDLTFTAIGSFSSVSLNGVIDWRTDGSLTSLGMTLRYSRMDGIAPAQDLNTLITFGYRWGL